jgi:asparagine synthase (glutamine-hydrolysing)
VTNERRRALALRSPNTFAGTVDLSRLAEIGAAQRPAETGGITTLTGAGFALATAGKLGSIRSEGGFVCAAVGMPRFEARIAADASHSRGAASGWIEAYRDLGAEMFAAAHGGWSVVLIDLVQKRLLAGVDRFAIRQLCFSATGRVFSFASRADEVAGATGEIDPQAIFDYAYHHFIPAPRTIFRGVERLDAAHRLLVEADRVAKTRYWQPQFAPVEVPFATRQELFLAALKGAVSDQMGDESIGCYLSGGTDSSTITGMVTEVTGRPAKTFSIGFDAAGYDEMEYARIAARHYGSDHHEYYITPDDLVQRIPHVASWFDQPFGNSSALPAYFCARVAHEAGVTRMLAGDGGDELFGGNSRYASDKLFTAYERVPALVKRALIEPLALGLPLSSVPLLRKGVRYVEIARMPVPGRMRLYNLLARIGPANVFTADFIAEVDADEPQRRELASFAATPAAATLNRTLAHEWKYILADNDLPKVMGTASLAGVDVAFPFLDDRLLDFSLGLPTEEKVRGRKLRYFFKEALRGFLPDEIIAKKKHGFGLPFGVWLVREPALRAFARASIDALAARGIVVKALSQTLFEERMGEHAGYYGEMVWILMMLEQWLVGVDTRVAKSPSYSTPTW